MILDKGGGLGPRTSKFRLDQKPSGAPDNLAAGIYFFKWDVGEVGVDTDTDKSEKLTIESCDVVLTWSQLVGDTKSVLANQKTIRGDYRLRASGNPPPNAKSAGVSVFAGLGGPSVFVAGETLVLKPGQVYQPDKAFHLGTLSIPENYHYVAQAQDDYASTDKHNRYRWALQRHAVLPLPRAVNLQFEGYPNPPPKETVPFGHEAADQQEGPLNDRRTGYLAQVHTNLGAEETFELLKNCTVFNYFGHGGTQRRKENHSAIMMWNGSTWSYLVDTPIAMTHFQNLPGQPKVIQLLSQETPFKNLLLAVFQGCSTAQVNESRSTFGSPARVVQAGGAMTSIGFTTTIYTHKKRNGELISPGTEEWSEAFWDVLCREGVTVEEAVEQARKVAARKGNGLGSVLIYGKKDLVLHPARFARP